MTHHGVLRLVATRAGEPTSHTLIPNLGGYWFDVVDGAADQRGGARMTRTRAIALVRGHRARAAVRREHLRRHARARRDLDPAEDHRLEPRFANNGTIPNANTCDGAGTEPTISWSAVPAHTKTVAVVVDDPDAPKGDFLQWLVIGLPAKAGSVPSRAPSVSELDNTGGTRGWSAPCPPAGSIHHYRFSVYALNDYVCADNGDSSNGPDCSPPSSVQALPQIQGTAIARGVLVGTVAGARTA